MIGDTSGSAFAMVEALEGRTLLSAPPLRLADFPGIPDFPSPPIVDAKARSRAWDAGDFYWYFDQKRRLLRATNEFVINVERGVNTRKLAMRLLHGPLEGFEQAESLDRRTLRFVNEEGLGK